MCYDNKAVAKLSPHKYTQTHTNKKIMSGVHLHFVFEADIDGRIFQMIAF